MNGQDVGRTYSHRLLYLFNEDKGAKNHAPSLFSHTFPYNNPRILGSNHEESYAAVSAQPSRTSIDRFNAVELLT